MTRLEANAIIDRLVADSQTFSRDDAHRLIGLIPVTRNRRLSFKGIFRGSEPSFRGHAAGHGNVEIDQETQEKSFELNAPDSYRIGGYVVTHMPGRVNIELMWSQTKQDRSGQICLLEYNQATREPRAMHIAVQKTLTVLSLTLAYVKFVPWKKPGFAEQ